MTQTPNLTFEPKCIVSLLPDFEARFPEPTVDLLLTVTVVDSFAERIDRAVRLELLVDFTLIARNLQRFAFECV